jgi:hypothetical protein
MDLASLWVDRAYGELHRLEPMNSFSLSFHGMAIWGFGGSFSNGIPGVGGEIWFQRLAWKLLGSSDSCEIGFGGRVEHGSLMQLFLTLILPSIGT